MTANVKSALFPNLNFFLFLLELLLYKKHNNDKKVSGKLEQINKTVKSIQNLFSGGK